MGRLEVTNTALRRYRRFDHVAGYADVRNAVDAGREITYDEATTFLGYAPEGPAEDIYILGLDGLGVFVIRVEGQRRVAITYLLTDRPAPDRSNP